MGDTTIATKAVAMAADEPAAPSCPQHGEAFVTIDPGFGGWQRAICTKCHRVVETKKLEDA